MNKETKIGLLTGLGVIIIIGVLLSEYLQTSGGGRGPGMAPLAGLGQSYRERVMSPVGVEPVIQPEQNSMVVSGGPVSTPTLSSMGNVGGITVSAGTAPDGGSVVLGRPVVTREMNNQAGLVAANTLVPAMPPVGVDPLRPEVFQPELTPGNALAGGTPGDLTLMSATAPGVPTSGYLRVAAVPPTAPTPAAVQGVTYVVVKGDSLTAIAKKFFHSAAVENQEKIVAANPTLFKDVSSPLKIGMKVIVPVAPKVVATASKPAAAKAASKPMVIGMPGSGQSAKHDVKTAESKAAADHTYTVAAGDTLSKIAKKTMGSGSHANVLKLAKLNGFDAEDELQVGEVLHVPTK